VAVIVCELDLQLPMQSVHITTDVFSVQHYVIKFVSDLRQGLWFFLGPPVSSTNKTDATI
jgi:hypothetical protein